jgi:RNA polymerase sigma factor (sigma-70 family)
LQRADGQIETEDDNAVMAKVAAKDALAFQLIVEREMPVIHRIAFRMLNNPTLAEDVAQETLLRLWTGASRWTGVGPGISAWLRRVATNICLDQLRRRRFSSDEEVPDRIDEAPLADAVIDENQVRSGLITALDTLGERQRAAIVLTYYEALPNAEAAEAMDMNIKAFESLLVRARHALKSAITDQQLISADDVRAMS